MNGRYILDANGEPIPEPDLLKWAMVFNDPNQRVKWTLLGDYTVSTIFLGLDHSFGSGPPILWETMVFIVEKETCTPFDSDRCSGSREQAMAMHQKMVDKITALIPK